jgi:hypothetical protein
MFNFKAHGKYYYHCTSNGELGKLRDTHTVTQLRLIISHCTHTQNIWFC